jgi:lipoprotein NlpD
MMERATFSTGQSMQQRVAKYGVAIAIGFALAACTTKVPAPIVDRTARPASPPVPAPIESRDAGSAPPSTTVQPAPATGVTIGVAPPSTISERGAPPAVSGTLPGNTPGSAFHVVQRGETLYRIAVNNGVSVEALAAWNNLDAVNPNIREGQVIRLRPPEGAITSVTPITGQPLPAPGPGAIAGASPTPGDARSAPPSTLPPAPLKTEPRAQRLAYSDSALTQMQRGDAAIVPPSSTVPGAAASSPSSVSAMPPTATSGGNEPARPGAPASTQPLAGESEFKPGNGVERDGVTWTWPTTGRLASRWNERAAMKGVDIAVKSGTPVVAAAAGKVIYVGKEPRGLGQMIVVSHAKETVSVYFHTDKVTVKEQQRVTLGQRIAEVADGGGDKMHFEVRRQGRPMDPLTLLPAR